MYINSRYGIITKTSRYAKTQTCYRKKQNSRLLKQLINFGQLKGLLAASWEQTGGVRGQPHWLIGEFLA